MLNIRQNHTLQENASPGDLGLSPRVTEDVVQP